MESKQVVVLVNGIEKNVPIGVYLHEILQEEKDFAMPCAGHGRCGKCKVWATGTLSEANEKERTYLTEQELERGIRLACQAKVLGECHISTIQEGTMEVVLNEQFVPKTTEKIVLTEEVVPKVTKEMPLNRKNISETTIEVSSIRESISSIGTVESSKRIFEKLGVAVDIGTTTLAVSLYDVNGFVGQMGAGNPQVTFGADVISRMEQSLNGKSEQLAKTVQRGIADLLKKISESHGRMVEDIDTLVVTGNTVMLYLLTKKNPYSLSRAPFQADWLAGEWIEARDFELGCPHAKVYLPCCISAFIGADITMALLYTNICRDNKKRLLVDIGTNGEVALWTGEKLLCCSTAAGPAFEGTGLTMGMTASTGAISKVFLECTARKGSEDENSCLSENADSAYMSSNEMFRVQVIGNTEPIGICGSGVIDAVSCLLTSEMMDETGYLEDEEMILAGTVKLTQEDIRKIQLAKSAICAGIETVLQQEGLCVDDLDELLIAGGFGSKIDLQHAMHIGLFPQMDVRKIKVCGNASLAGAERLLHNRALLEKQQEIIQNSQSFELATNAFFQERYIEGMLF